MAYIGLLARVSDLRMQTVQASVFVNSVNAQVAALDLLGTKLGNN